MPSTEQRKRIEANVFSVALLDEIADRLARLEDIFIMLIPRGYFNSYELSVGTTDSIHLIPSEDMDGYNAFQASIINDGPNVLLIGVNSPSPSDDTIINPGEEKRVDFKSPKLEQLSFVATGGNTSVRVDVIG